MLFLIKTSLYFSLGIMPAPGFSIVADIELLKTEIVLYFVQFGIDERSLTGDLALVWKLIQSGEGQGWKSLARIV